MRTIFLITISVFFIIPLCGKAQTEEKKIINDSTFVLGVIPEDCYVGKEIATYCTVGFDKELSKGSVVFVCGTQKCTKLYSSESNDFFEIIYNAKQYYIEKNKLIIKEYTFDDINNLTAETAKKFKDYSIYMSKLIYEKDITDAIDFLKARKTNGLAIYDWSFYDESKYTEGTSAKVTVYNPTSKTIKYIWFSFVGYNPVEDKVIDRITGTSIITKKAVGPIANDETATYEFSYVWDTDIVETAKIVSIKVLYMDGTQKIISDPKAITLSSKFRSILEDD